MDAHRSPAIDQTVAVDGGTVVVETRSTVAAAQGEVWAAITTFGGVNHELMPYCRMVPPRRLRGRTLDSYEPAERAACWLLAGGIVPFDRHLLGLESVHDGVGFVEESTTWLQARWRHERSLSSADGGTLVVDRLTIVPRLRPATVVIRRLVPRIFAHRHRRLAQQFPG